MRETVEYSEDTNSDEKSEGAITVDELSQSEEDVRKEGEEREEKVLRRKRAFDDGTEKSFRNRNRIRVGKLKICYLSKWHRGAKAYKEWVARRKSVKQCLQRKRGETKKKKEEKKEKEKKRDISYDDHTHARTSNYNKKRSHSSANTKERVVRI